MGETSRHIIEFSFYLRVFLTMAACWEVRELPSFHLSPDCSFYTNLASPATPICPSGLI